MRISRALTALTAAGLLTGTITGTAGMTGAAHAAAGCTPNWKLVPTPPPPGNAEISGAAVVSGKDAWFPGWTLPAAGGKEAWSLHWDGHSLGVTAPIPQVPVDTQDASAASFDSATDGWVLGSYGAALEPGQQYAARWYGGRWTITPLAVSPDPTTSNVFLSQVASLSPSDAWAVGEFNLLNQDLGALIEHWDGTQWSIVANPAASQPGTVLNAISVVSASDIWAVGEAHPGGGAGVPFAEHFDGTTWSVVPAPAGNQISGLLAVSADGPADAWAVGFQVEPGTSNAAAAMVEHWDGTAWSVVTSLPDLGNSKLQQVYAASPTDVWATVYTPLPNGFAGVADFLHFDGTSWTTVPLPGPQEYGLDYQYTGIDGTGPDNIWGAGYSSPAGSGADTPVIAHLSCG